jgi:molybdate transport system regulatory protein
VDVGDQLTMAKARGAKRSTVRIRILAGSEIAMGPGKADLLDAIAETGSISAAARRMRMSYRRAWLLVRTMNECFAKPLVSAAKGGKTGGGASLTETGAAVLARYREVSNAAAAALSPFLSKAGR